MRGGCRTCHFHAGAHLGERDGEVVGHDGELRGCGQRALIRCNCLLQAPLLLVDDPQVAVRLRIARVGRDRTRVELLGSRKLAALTVDDADIVVGGRVGLADGRRRSVLGKALLEAPTNLQFRPCFPTMEVAITTSQSWT